MKILSRYITWIFIKNFMIALFALAGLNAFQMLLGQLLDHEFTFQQILIHNLLAFPEVIVQMIPPGVLIGTVLTLAGLNRSNELVACFSIGIGLPQILTILFSIVVIICCLSLVLQDRVLPPVFKKKTTFYWRDMKRKSDFFFDVRQDKIWYRSKNLIYYLRTFDNRTRTITGMGIYTFSTDFDLIQVLGANTAEYNGSGWTLRDGTVTVFSPGEGFPLSQPFKERNLQIPETPKDFQEIEREIDGLRILELYRYIQRIKEAGADSKVYEMKLQSKLSLSFIPLVMCILAVPFSTGNKREGGIARDLGICLVVTFFYWLLYSVGMSLGSNGALHPIVAAWTPSLIFFGIAISFTIYRPR